jgi:site-specific DNA-methyltransferase (adenine-specific)
VGGFPGDPRTPEGLAEWYRPHVEAWSQFAHPATTLWFWNTEVGWATIHPLLVQHGWNYEFASVWNKGVAHIAGNVNGNTIRRLPVVTEVCVFYSRGLTFTLGGDHITAQEWVRSEWKRSGLPFRRANEACGVKDAATRKYFATDWLWYFPPPDMMEKLAAYANAFGDPRGRPYYTIDGKNPVTAELWATLRYKWNHQHGVTNVWDHPPLHSKERIRGTGRRAAPRVYSPTLASAAHLNQKPLRLMERIIEASTDQGDVVWEPFGGLCSATVAAIQLGRKGYAAEIDPGFYELANARLLAATRGDDDDYAP